MTTLFAPPEILAAYSYAVDGSDPDETLQKGTHLRVFAGLGGSFPLAPFAVFRVVTRQSEPRGLHFVDRTGAPIRGGDLSQLGTVDVTPSFGDDETRRTVRVEWLPSPVGSLKSAQLLDSQGRVIAERRDPRYLFSAPTLSKFRLTGGASDVGLTSRVVTVDDLLKDQQLQTADLLGLPVTGRHAWYVGVQDHAAALERVKLGAPRRLNAMDQPDGPFDPIVSDEEVARINAMTNPEQFAGGAEQLAAAMVDDDTRPPWLQVEGHALGARNQNAIVPRLGSIQMAAIDPGIARLLGFATRIEDLPDLDQGRGWTALAVIGLIAIDPGLGTAMPLLADWLKQPDPDEPKLVDMLLRAIRDITGTDAQRDIDDLRTAVAAQGFIVRAMVAFTAPTPPWLAPALPTPVVVDHRWQASDGLSPSSLYRVTFGFLEPPLAAMAAVGGNFDGTWASRHGSVQVTGIPSTRATPRIFGHEAESTSRLRRFLKPGSAAAVTAAGLLADENLPADAGRLSYRFRASDFFGRFGDARETTLDPPPRPNPPPPVLRYHLDLNETNLEELPDTGPLSPGDLRVTFVVPQPPPAPPFLDADAGRIRTAISVPGLRDLAAGSLPIVAATVTVNGASQDADLSAPGLVEIAIPLDALDPQAKEQVTLTAAFRDSGGTASETTTVTFAVTDRRPLKPIETGIGLFWTSAAGPAPDVQLKLGWRSAPNAQFRVYVTDQHGLGLSAADLVEHVPGAAPSRGRVAEVGANKVLSGAPIDRRTFRLLADTVKADGAGQVVFETMLPRSLDAVQFLRLVPLSAEGAEAPFDRCGIVPVAVPASRRPPLPRVDGHVDPATGHAMLTVTADGFDGVALRRDEPGLFDPAAGAGVAPSFRVRRAVGAVADPIYGREVAAGTLAHDANRDPAVVFTGNAEDTNQDRPLEPFVRYVYWADVRLPPERRLPVGVVPLDAGVTAADPANAADYTSPTSLPSAPRTLMRFPADAPAAPAVVNVTPIATLGGLTIEFTVDVTDPPKAHPKAIGPYRLAVWTQWPGEAIQTIVGANEQPFDGTWPELGDGSITITVAPPSPAVPPVPVAGPITVRVACVDPIGRVGDLTIIEVP
jgi:hypothetical protein